jgi:hypothetical protein
MSFEAILEPVSFVFEPVSAVGLSAAQETRSGLWRLAAENGQRPPVHPAPETDEMRETAPVRGFSAKNRKSPQTLEYVVGLAGLEPANK